VDPAFSGKTGLFVPVNFASCFRRVVAGDPPESEDNRRWGALKEGAILGSERFMQGARDRLTGDRLEKRAADRRKQERLD
jgi:hypothetical protein